MASESTKMGALNETECTFEFIKVAASQTLTKGTLCTVDASGNAIVCPTSYAGATQTYVIDEDVTTAASEVSKVTRFVKTGPVASKIDAAVTEGAAVIPSGTNAGQIKGATVASDSAWLAIGYARPTEVGGSSTRIEWNKVR